MEVSWFVFFLAALARANSNLVFKKYNLINTPMTWPGARDYCKQNHVDLSITDTKKEFTRFTSQTAADASVRSWIGLNKKPTETKYTQWCDGTVLSFTSWYPNEPSGISDQHCITTTNNLWSDYYCDLTMPVMCYSEVILVEEMKTWDEAHEYCRTNYTDLFSVTEQVDLLLINDIKQNITSNSFWTGMRFLDGLWVWVNKEPMGNLVPQPPCPNHPLVCVASDAGTNTLKNRDCNEKMYFACARQGSN